MNESIFKEPGSTGIGGDCFCLFYDAKTKKVDGLNGSGRSPAKLTLEYARNVLGIVENRIPSLNINAATVPGTAAGWVDTIDWFGSGNFKLAEILQPAIDLAENGYPVSEISAWIWKDYENDLINASTNGCDMLIDGRAPRCGEIMRMPNLARTFRELGEKGKDGFYKGRIAQAIVETVQSRGGVMSLDDLASHTSTRIDPISINYKDVTIWECPPNGQGITVLMALGIIKSLQESGKIRDLSEMAHNSAEYLHVVIESLRLAFADSTYYVADPDFYNVTKELLSKAVIPNGCGFTLQSRGNGFVLEKDHPNCLEPCKRPYHTIIPAIATRGDELWLSFGVMGAFMQPQGHVQVLLNLLHHSCNPQTALDSPRILIEPLKASLTDKSSISYISVEDGISEDVINKLRQLGHHVKVVKGFQRSMFGRGQIIEQKIDSKSGLRVWAAGSDFRGDGHAIGW
ncbi:8423_t:CDS:2 [Cetraspora pellucida]|uniref:8423_t:CDS:1 n=1 Tax=Cetraspora pellucida TaxID=1433469 RepID=A0ACA9LZL5_9GLOM|nr:8423_t:CDS:2 [Cetraspora pellucida]